MQGVLIEHFLNFVLNLAPVKAKEQAKELNVSFWGQLIDQNLLLWAQRQEIAVDMPDVLEHAVAKSFGIASMYVGHPCHSLHQGGFATSICAN